MLHTMFPPSQLVENKLIVWLLFLAKADRRSKKDWETRFLRAHGRAVNVLSFTCSLFLESKTHVQPKFKWHNLTLLGISPRKKNVHEVPPEYQSANLPKELFWIIIIPLVWNTRWNWGNLRFAWLNANHLCFCSPLKVTRRCGVHLKSAPEPSLCHVGLNDGPLFPTGEGGMSTFLVDSIGPILDLGCPRGAKIFMLWTLDPLGPTWGAARSEKYLHPPGTPPEVAGPEKRPNRPISTYMEQCRLTTPSTFHG